MKVAIIGTQGLPLPLCDFKKILPKPKNTELIAGTEDSVDIWVLKYAIAYKFKYRRFTPKSADYPAMLENIRNIIQEADKVLIFWDGVSYKTADAIKECLSMKKDFNIYTTFKK